MPLDLQFTAALGIGLLAACSATVPAAAAPLVTAYDDDGAITVDGKRTIIIGTYHVGNRHTAPEPNQAAYDELAETGFNLVHGNANTLDMIHTAGLMAWTNAGTLDPDTREESAQKILDAVNAVKDHPALAFLETVDEPAWTWMKAEARIPAEALIEAYPIIKGADPNHLLYTNHAPTNLVKTMRAYNDGTDIVAMDIYPVNPGGLKHSYALFEDGHQGDLNNIYISQVGDYVDKMREVTGPNRPLVMVLQGFAWEMLVDEAERREEKILYPTYAQSRFMAFQSLIKGANGIIYWGTAYTPQPSQFWTDLKRVVREVADLAEPLAERSSNLALEIDYHELGRSVDDGVQWLAKEHDGSLYLFTCNADKNPCRATLSGLDGWTNCTVLNENRNVRIENGAITDDWRRFDVHIYRFSK
ncbi:MAG: hypothetical protein KJ060_13015 [Candidatus Hydrogenedentes bacterium]|nr:hypothetical protein [Candidatus Hydrogenedentota bacterium]